MADVRVNQATESQEERWARHQAESDAKFAAMWEAQRERVDRALAELEPVPALVKALKDTVAAKDVWVWRKDIYGYGFSPEAELARDILDRQYAKRLLPARATARAEAVFLLGVAWDDEHMRDSDHLFQKALLVAFEDLLAVLEGRRVVRWKVA